MKRGRHKLHSAGHRSKTKESQSAKGDAMVVDVAETMQVTKLQTSKSVNLIRV